MPDSEAHMGKRASNMMKSNKLGQEFSIDEQSQVDDNPVWDTGGDRINQLVERST